MMISLFMVCLFIFVSSHDSSTPVPVECDLPESARLVSGMGKPLNSDQINVEDAIEVQEEWDGKNEDSRNRTAQKTDAMLQHDRR